MAKSLYQLTRDSNNKLERSLQLQKNAERIAKDQFNVQREQLLIVKSIQEKTEKLHKEADYQKSIKSLIFNLNSQYDEYDKNSMEEAIYSIYSSKYLENNGMSSDSFIDIPDKEYFKNFIKKIKASQNNLNETQRSLVNTYFDNRFKLDNLNQLESDLLKHRADNKFYLTIITILAWIPPVIFIRPIVIKWQKDIIYYQFRSIASLTSPNPLFTAEKFPFYGLYPEIKNIKKSKELEDYIMNNRVSLEKKIQEVIFELPELSILEFNS